MDDMSSTYSEGILVQRPAIDNKAFDELCKRYPKDETPFWKNRLQTLRNKFKKENFTKATSKIKTLLPFLDDILTYKIKAYLLHDILSGCTVGMIHVCQGMAFALLSDVAPVYGLYSSFFPVLIYFFFGSSRHLSVGTMAVISILVGSVVSREAAIYASLHVNATEVPSVSTTGFDQNITWNGLNSDDISSDLELYKATVAASVSLVASIIMLAMGFLKLGIIRTLMPRSFIGGFTTAAAFQICTSQLRFLLGIGVKRFDGIFRMPLTWADVLTRLIQCNVATVVLSIITSLILIFFKEFINKRFRQKLPIPVPIEMILLLIISMLSHFLEFNTVWGIEVVGPLPNGFPVPFLPTLERLVHIFTDAVVIAVLSFVISISMADIFGRKYKYNVDPNQELLAYGMSYGIAAFFYSFIGAAAPPRCFIQESTGAKTRIANIFSLLILFFVILYPGPLFKNLPRSVLACIVVVSLFPLFKQFKDLIYLWKISKVDFSVWIITWLSTMVLNLVLGLIIGIVWALISVTIVGIWKKGQVLGRIKYGDLYAPMEKYGNLSKTKGVIIFKFEQGLFFATVGRFMKELDNAVSNPESSKQFDGNENESTIQKCNKLRGKCNKAFAAEGLGEPQPDDGTEEKQTNSTNKVADAINDEISGVKNEESTKYPKSETDKITIIVVDCSAISYIDSMGLDCLKSLSEKYKSMGINFALVGCTSTLIDTFEIDDLNGGEVFHKLKIFPTVNDAIILQGHNQACHETFI